MYTNATRRLLSTVVDTSREGVREDRTRLLKDIKLLYALTTYFDTDTFWEASHLAAQKFVTAATAIDTLMDSLTLTFQTSKQQTIAPPKVVLQNTLDGNDPSPARYVTALEAMIKRFPRRDTQDTKEYGLATQLQQLRVAFRDCLWAAQVLENIPNSKLQLFTGYFRERVVAWVDEVLSKEFNTIEAVERLGTLYELVSMASTSAAPAELKYSGACTVGNLSPASIALGPPVYAVPAGTTMNWRSDPAVGFTTWTLPTASPATLNIGPGCSSVVPAPLVPNQWTIVGGINDFFYCRANNIEFTNAAGFAAGVYTTAQMVALLTAGVAGAVPLPFTFIASGNDILLQMTADNCSPGMQLYFPAITLAAPSNFNLTCAEGEVRWAGGAYADKLLTSADAPTAVREVTYPTEQVTLDATLTITGDLVLASPQLAVRAGDLLTVLYNNGSAIPLSAQYMIATIVGGTDITVAAGLSAPTDFIAIGQIPLTTIGVAEAVTVQITREEVSFKETPYLELAGNVDIDAPAAAVYSTGTTVTLSDTETVPLRIGDLVRTSATTATITGLSPVTVSSLSYVTTSAEILSGLQNVYGNLVIGSELKKSLKTSTSLLRALDQNLSAMTWSTFAAFKGSTQPLLTDIEDLALQLTIAFSLKRLPRVIALLRQHGFDRSALLLRRGDLLTFLPQTALEATGVTSVLQQLSDIINSL
jgi:hypothetical protein